MGSQLKYFSDIIVVYLSHIVSQVDIGDSLKIAEKVTHNVINLNIRFFRKRLDSEMSFVLLASGTLCLNVCKQFCVVVFLEISLFLRLFLLISYICFYYIPGVRCHIRM